MNEKLWVLPGFGAPWFLLLLATVPFVVWTSRRRHSDLTRLRRASAMFLRCCVLVCVVLALAESHLSLRNDRLSVFFLVDRSASIPEARREAVLRYVNEASKGRDVDRGDQVGLIGFGDLAGIEIPPRADELSLESYETLVDSGVTDIAGAIRLASVVLPQELGKRIVLLTDGNETRESVLEAARAAREQGIVVDVVPISYVHGNEIWVEKLIVPAYVRLGAPFDVRVVVGSTHDTEAHLRLLENGVPVADTAEAVSLLGGRRNVFEFKGRRFDRPGRFEYEAQLEPVRIEDDSISRNNTGLGFAVIQGESRVLLCTREPELEGALIAALREERISVETTAPEFIPRDLEAFLDYDAIVFSNVAASEVSVEQMKAIEALVKTVGIGFVMLGGENSFGAGMYQGTPIERLLPVDMEIKQQRILPNGAIAFVVHSSELDQGNWWARQVIQRCLRILSPRDYAGVVYFGGRDTWLFPMWPIQERQRMLQLLGGFNPGDMPMFEPVMQLALRGLESTPAATKHMIVLSDGDPAPPSDTLLVAIRAAGITISTVCYGGHGQDLYLQRMKEIASAGKGEFYFLRSPEDLPEILIRETTKVQRSLISEEPFIPLVASRGALLRGLPDEAFPALKGYVIATPKELATLHLLHPAGEDDPAEDPVLAAWTYGLGRSVAFTSDAGRRWGKAWTGWSGYQRFWGQCLRWVSRAQSDDDFRLEASLDGERAYVFLDAITVDGELLNGLRFEGSVIGPDREVRALEVRQSTAGRYAAEFPALEDGTYTVVLTRSEGERVTSHVTSVSIPYSREYARLTANTSLLRRVAEAGGGKYLEDPDRALETAEFFARDFPVSYRTTQLWWWLLVAAACIFFVDVFVRRVVVDYAAIVADLFRRRTERSHLREPAVAPRDGRLSTLLERKQASRQVAAPAFPRQEHEPESSHDSNAGATQGEDAGSKVMKDDEEVSQDGFTARLLAAKRRAQRDRKE